MAADGPKDPRSTPPGERADADVAETDARAETDALPIIPPPPATDAPAAPDVGLADTMAGDSDRIARALAGTSDAFAATLGHTGSGEFGPATMQGMKALHYAVGDTISGRYEVRGVLGQGGFAVVYRAWDRVVDREVAIKVLNTFADAVDETNTQRAVERFEREARAAAMVTHSNVVTIFDLGVADRFGRPYIVMELLEGHDLSDELKNNGAMAPARALTLFTGALAGLAAGHERGIVHKDLKPANLFLTAPGTEDEKLNLFDFGIARLGAGEAGLTKTGEMFGTPQYMAPEYISAGQVSPALDVYQMGLILVEMFTGRKVVEADVAITAAMAHGKGALPLPIELLQGPLGDVLLGALAHDPEVRFADASAFLAALESALEDVDPVSLACPSSGETQLLSEAADPTTGRLRPETVQALRPDDAGRGRGKALVAIVALLAVAVGGWWMMQTQDPPPPPLPPTAGEPTMGAARVDAAPPPPDAAPEDATPKDAAPKDAAPPIVVKLVVEPAGATITVDGAPAAGGLLEFADEDAPALQVAVRHAGYQPAERSVGPGDGPQVDIRLERAAARTPEPPRPVKPDPPKPPPTVVVVQPPDPAPPETPPPPPPEPEPAAEPEPEPESGAVILD